MNPISPSDANASAPFAKQPTIHDVAAALGLHKSSVSLAFSGKGNLSAATRERILATAKELGYEPNPLAQRLSNGVSNSLVCLCSGGLDVGLMTEKVLLIQKELSKTSLEVPIYTFSEVADGRSSQATQVKALCRQMPRAIVCAAQMLSRQVFHELERYQSEGGIVVSYDVAIPLQCDQVIFDREDNAYRGAKYLIEHGHRDLGIALSNLQQTGDIPNISQNLRLEGFRRALREADLPLREEWIFLNQTYEKGGAAMARHFLGLKNRPTALCIVNDYVALAFMVEVMRAGLRVPEDVSIVGHDDQPVASYCPVPLTSVSQPATQVAHAVVELLRERIAGSQIAPRHLTIRGELIERQSVHRLAS